MDLRLTLAIVVGKLSAFLIKLFGGGATAAPGFLALHIDPLLVKKLSKSVKNGSIVISGTNGKTTCARLIAQVLSGRYTIIHNRAGSNLLRGIATTLLKESSMWGKLDRQLGIWEVDEATVPDAIRNLSPKIVVFLNLMRDQLDRYGEVDSVRIKWQKAIEHLAKDTTLILNADDPGISILRKQHKGKVIFFGINDKKVNLPPVESVADVRHCLNCGSLLNYSTILSAHMGHYQCPKCHSKRPSPDIFATNLKFKLNFSTSLTISINHSPLTIDYPLPGLYNVYNVLAVASVAKTLKIDESKIKNKLEKFAAAFGRFQQIKIGSKKVIIFLLKNPAGTNEVIRTIAKKKKLNLLAILNDKIADGRDVSWIWDSNWEILAPKIKNIGVSGTRADDLALRLKYAGFKLSKNNIYKEVNYSILKSLENLDTKDTLLILPTYTGLLEVQKTLSRVGDTLKWYEQ